MVILKADLSRTAYNKITIFERIGYEQLQRKNNALYVRQIRV